MNNLQKWMQHLNFEKEQTHKSLTIIPITSSESYNLDFITLRSALDRKFATVKELHEDGSVPEVIVINKSDKHLILLDGEHVIGAKQNRIINKTIIVDPLSEVVIPVSCTEQGRWQYKSAGFRKSNFNASSSIRRASKMGVKSQGGVWSRIASISKINKFASRTFSLNELYDEVAPKFDNYKRIIQAIPSQIGIMAFINGKLAGIDLIGDNKLFAEQYDSLIHGYMLDAISNSLEESPKSDIEGLRNHLLEEIRKSKLTSGENIGAEKRELIKAEDFMGELVSFKDMPVHLAVFHR